MSQLLPEGITGAERGAAAFAHDFGPLIRAQLNNWVLYCSPLTRTKDTALPYVSALREAGILVPEPTVDDALIEINHGTWSTKSVQALRDEGRDDAERAAEYRDGSFVAKTQDGSGEAILDVVVRAADWLRELEARHGSSRTNVLVFGHGTFQNAVELLMRVHPDKSPTQLFSRVSGGSHLRRGEAHLIADLV